MRNNALPQTLLPPRDGVPPELLRAVRRRARSFVGTLVFLNGEAELRDAISGSAVPAETGIRISSECTLAMKRGCGLVRLDDGSDLWLSEATEIDFSAWGGPRRDLRLVLGRMLALVAREAARPFQVVTPVAQITVTGTAFEASAAADALEIAVFHGSVECRSAAGQARARRGDGVQVKAGGAPQVRRLPAGGAAHGPGMLLALSSENPKIQAACRAVRRTCENAMKDGEGRHAGMLEYLQARWRMLLIVCILLGAGVVAWRHFQARPVPEVSGKPAVAAISEPAIAAISERAIEPGKAVSVMRDQRPGQKDEADGRPSGEGQARPDPLLGMTVPQKNAMMHDISGGMNSMQGMIRAGMSPQKAAALTQRGLQESLNKQFQAQGGTAPQINVYGDWKFLIHKAGPQPPAGQGGARGGSSGGASK